MKWHLVWNWTWDYPDIDNEDRNFTFKRRDYLPEGYGVTNDHFTNPEVITPSTTYIITKGRTIIQLHDDLCDGACCRIIGNDFENNLIRIPV